MILHMIIAGFPCVGKTTMAKKFDDVLDLSSTKFHYFIEENLIGENLKGHENDLLVNPNWPQNYVDEILKIQNKYKIVFILARDYILKELNRLNVAYCVAIPEDGLEQEYLLRAQSRGNEECFIQGLKKRYEEWRNMMIAQPVKKIYLKKGEFIIDTLRRLKIYGG